MSDDPLPKPDQIPPVPPQESPLASPTESPAEELSLLSRVQAQCRSTVAVHRLLLARKIPQLVEQIGFEDSSKHIIPILDDMTDDPESGVRQSLCEQLGPLGAYFNKHGPVGYQLIRTDLLRLTEKLLTDGATNVRDAALLITLELAKLLQKEDVVSCVLPIIDRLARSVDQEDYRVSATVLLNSLAPLMDRSVVEDFSIPILRSFASDQMFRVRKGVASNVDLLCQVLEQENVTKLFLPIFLELSQDEIWGVRKACCDSLVAFSKYVSPEQRSEALVPMFDRLATDSSRWVKSAALLSLGPFIATFKGYEVADTLLEHYKSMNNSEDQQTSLGETDHVTNCAHNFPAVLDTLGAHRWGELSEIYIDLTKNTNVKVRRTLAFSLHCVAAILGEALTEEILCPIFEAFFTDLDDVKIGVIKHISKFLSFVPLPTRRTYLHKLLDFQNGKNSWRQRKLIAKQMGSLATLYDAETVGTVLIPIMNNFLIDPVAAVRSALVTQMPIILQCVSSVPSTYKDLITQLQSFSKPTSHAQQKIWFCKVVPLLAVSMEPNLFDEYFVQSLIQLSHDSIANTRIFVAAALLKIISSDTYKDNEQLKQLIEILQKDKDKDVKISAGSFPDS